MIRSLRFRISDFPDDVLAEANAVPNAPTNKDLIGRVDLRQEVTFTIDGADAKDLDDAVHIKLLDNGHFELGVHIADVSYYVTPGSVVDNEARSRGTSVYLVDRTVPMLPEKLSTYSSETILKIRKRCLSQSTTLNT